MSLKQGLSKEGKKFVSDDVPALEIVPKFVSDDVPAF